MEIWYGCRVELRGVTGNKVVSAGGGEKLDGGWGRSGN